VKRSHAVWMAAGLCTLLAAAAACTKKGIIQIEQGDGGDSELTQKQPMFVFHSKVKGHMAMDVTLKVMKPF
jgi:hypothetical protein